MTDDFREESPDWLRSFQPSAQSAIFLSSGSESPLSHRSASDDDDDVKDLKTLFKLDGNKVSDINDDGAEDGRRKKRKNKDASETPGKMSERKVATRKKTGMQVEPQGEEMHSIFSLSSDPDSPPDTKTAKRDKTVKKGSRSSNIDNHVLDNTKTVDEGLLDQDEESPKVTASKVKPPKEKSLQSEDGKASKKMDDNTNGENDANTGVLEEDITPANGGRQVSSSRLPLLLSDKVQYSKALVECEGDSIDLSGDVGAVGRVVISEDHSKNHDMFLDLKGTIYRATIVPSRTFCVVSFGQSEAKIEAIMNDYIQLKQQSNVYEAETMVEGTLDGFSFDSEDEADHVPKAIAQGDEDEAAEEQPAGKGNKRAQKTAGGGRNKGKAAGGKPAKKVKKKPQVAKKSKTKK